MKAMSVAKRLVKTEIRASGSKISDFTHKQITQAAEELLYRLVTDTRISVNEAGKAGAAARNAKLTPEQRHAIAKRAAWFRHHTSSNTVS